MTGWWALPKPTKGLAPGPHRLWKKAGENFISQEVDYIKLLSGKLSAFFPPCRVRFYLAGFQSPFSTK